jgi:hypothetical protein
MRRATTSPATGKPASPVRVIRRPSRIALTVVGAASWAAGGAACFVSQNGTGAAALVITGTLGVILALMGRWPSHITLSGNDLAWDDVERVVDSQISAARQGGDSDTSVSDLEEVKQRLVQLQQTGTVPEHPAEIYDRDVHAAISRLLPDAAITPQGRSRDVADFVVRYRGRTVHVETKWRSDREKPFGGSTLPRLFNSLASDSRLVVVINSTVPPAINAIELMAGTLADRGRIVQWRGVQDDAALGAALTALLGISAGSGSTEAPVAVG